jgi:hypothetical protein
MRALQRWARGRQWRIPFLALIGVIAVIGSLLLYKPAIVDKGPLGLVVLDLALFFGGGFLATWATIAWQAERRKVYQRRATGQATGSGKKHRKQP